MEKPPDRAYDCMKGSRSLEKKQYINPSVWLPIQTMHIYADSSVPCETLGRPVHYPPEHRHDAIRDVAPWFVAGYWYTDIEKKN